MLKEEILSNMRAPKPDTIALGITLTVLAVTAALPLKSLILGFVIDDALYYPRIAQNIMEGYGITYDKFTITNGFHPLWLIFNLVPAWATDNNHLLQLRVVFVLEAIILASTFYCIYRFFRLMKFHPLASSVSMLILLFARIDLWFSVMEAVLSFFMLALIMYLIERKQLLTTSSVRWNILFGLLLGALFLSRLDTIFIVTIFYSGSILMRVLSRQEIKRTVANMVVSGTAFLLVGLPYVLWNIVNFGHLMPVSGYKKSNFDVTFDRVIAAFVDMPMPIVGKLLASPWLILPIVIVMFIGVGLIWMSRDRGTVGILPTSHSLIAIYSTGVLTRWIYLRLFLPESSSVPWYWVPEYFLFAILLAYVGTWFIRSTNPKIWQMPIQYLGVGALIVMGTFYAVQDARAVTNINLVDFETAIWARDSLPRDSVFAMYDSGYFSYFSQRDTLALNGLATDFPTTMDIIDGKSIDVLKRFEIDYLVVRLNEDTASRLHDSYVVYRSQAAPGGSLSGQRIYILDLKNPLLTPSLLDRIL